MGAGACSCRRMLPEHGIESGLDENYGLLEPGCGPTKSVRAATDNSPGGRMVRGEYLHCP